MITDIGTKTIYKYPLKRLTELTLRDPKVVHVAMQHDEPFVWIEHVIGFTNTKLTLRVIGTGQKVPEGTTHVGTFLDRAYVWHVYEERTEA